MQIFVDADACPVVSIVVIRFLMSYIKKHDFTVFGWYRIVLGVLVLIGGITGFIG